MFDALTSVRVYKHAWSQADAVAYIIGARGSQFEPEVVDAFLRVIGRRIPALRTVIANELPSGPSPSRQHH